MLKKLISTTIIASSLALLSGNALADGAKENGVYLEGNAGYAKINETVNGATTNDNKGWAFNVNGGYKINKNFGMELGYFYLPTEKFSNATTNASGKNYAIDLALRGIIPFDNGMSIFGKIGPAWRHINRDNYYPTSDSSLKGSQSAFVGLIGAGLGYAFTENLEATVQGVAMTKNGDKIPASWLGTVGLTYTF